MLTVSVIFIGGTYEAALDGQPEWPPHPGRVFNALVAQAEPESNDQDALLWLENQPPPVVLATEAKGSSLEAYVPTNAVDAAKDTHQSYLGRRALPRAWHRSHPERAEIMLAWEAADPAPEVVSGLARLCRRVPYLGRVSSPVVMTVGVNPPDSEGFLRWEHPGDRSIRLRVPQPNTLAALRQAYDTGQPARSVDRWVAYGQPVVVTPEDPAVSDGPWPELLTFGFPPGHYLDGRQAARVAIAWRKAVLSTLGPLHSPEELALLHGHHDGAARQCAFFALPDVGHPHADGQLRGLALALSVDLPATVRRSLLTVLGMDLDAPRLDGFFVPGLSGATLPLAHGLLDGRQVVDPDRWTGGAGQTRWSSVLPVVLDRYPHRRETAEEHLIAACRLAGFPEPLEVDVQSGSAVEGALRLRQGDLRRRPSEPARPALHCRLAFAEPVRGPMLLGHLRHVGLGLMLPSGAS